MNCHDCKYVGDVPGASHRCCNFLKEMLDPKEANLMEMGYIAKAVEIVITNSEGEKRPAIKLVQQGVEGGWCMYPVNFDPVWIEDCVFFKDINSYEESEEDSSKE